MKSGATIVVIDADRSAGERLAAAVAGIVAGLAEIRIVADVAEALDVAENVLATGGIVPIAFVDLDSGAGPGADTVVTLHRHPDLAATRVVLVTSRASLRDVDRPLQLGAVHGMLTKPWSAEGLTRLVRANLATFLVEHAVERYDTFEPLLGADDRDRARERVQQRHAQPVAATAVSDTMLGEPLTDLEIQERMVGVIDRALGHPPRIRVAPGTVMISEGDDVGGIFLILEGSVRLTSHRESGAVVVHDRSTGAIVGLLSLASRRRAMHRCVATTDVRAIPLTLSQLDRALAVEPEFAGLLTQVLISSLARRLRRSDELQVELDESLAALSEARAQLVATARFAALGEMAAGMAHELNNPTAALARAADHLVDDIVTVVDDREFATSLVNTIEDGSPTPADLRRRRRELLAVVDDPADADRLAALGIEPRDAAAALADRDELERLEALTRLGATVHNIIGVTERIQGLVDSLRNYARGGDGGGEPVDGVDVTAGLDDALRLVAHRLTDVDVVREYTDHPTVTGRPGALQQVWSNLIINALDAIDDHGTITISVRLDDEQAVVAVGDDGPGVPAELVERIFEPRFTTKHGRVRFGLGLGLSISRQIIDDHDGTIAVSTQPGNTVFTVTLPTGGPS